MPGTCTGKLPYWFGLKNSFKSSSTRIAFNFLEYGWTNFMHGLRSADGSGKGQREHKEDQ